MPAPRTRKRGSAGAVPVGLRLQRELVGVRRRTPTGYGILELGARDTGPYKRFHVVDAASLDPNALAGDGD
ncbi:hypothetical protein ZEAMMB73_Zm00001d020755 [Zea mays]|jgi:hypothetical protein|uniref:Uncharacterized protein n=1 Tax=Zea mays TaxID=4577 RepID=A0A1D6I619_MAIZE|nr:hypothetical protein ZEAMMB73_Zm00001d020755 [Zea mays]